MDSNPDAEGGLRVLPERLGAQQLELHGVRRDGGRGLSREAPSSGRVPLEDVRVDRRDQGAIPRPRDSAPTEGRPTRAEAAQALRPRLARWTDSSVRLDERRLDEESGEELLGPARLARYGLPLLEHLAIRRFETHEHRPPRPAQL